MNKNAFKIDVKDLETCRKEVTVQVPQKEVKAAFDNTLNNINTSVNLPGFRAGKAPKALLLKKYSKEVGDQVRQDIFRAVMESVFEDESSTPVTTPEIDQGEISQKEDFSFSMKYDVRPDFELPDYKSLKLDKVEIEVTEEEIKAKVDEMCERFATLQIVEQAAADDDFVKCNFTGTVEGLEEGAEIPESAQGVLEGEERWIPVKENSLLPGALQGLKGKKAGDEAEWQAEFEEDYPVDLLKGKKVSYKCTVKEVHSRVIPELDDEIAKNAGAESVEDLKQKVEEGEKNAKTAEQINKNKEKVIELLVEGFECTLPPTLFKNEVLRTIHSLKHEKGIDHDCGHDYKESDSCKTDDCCDDEEKNVQEDLKKEAEEKAAKDLKTRFLLSKIAQVEEVKVEEFEVQYQIYMMAQQYGVDPKVFAEQLQANGSIEEFQEQILIDKTLSKIVELNLPSDKKEESEEK